MTSGDVLLRAVLLSPEEDAPCLIYGLAGGERADPPCRIHSYPGSCRTPPGRLAPRTQREVPVRALPARATVPWAARAGLARLFRGSSLLPPAVVPPRVHRVGRTDVPRLPGRRRPAVRVAPRQGGQAVRPAAVAGQPLVPLQLSQEV